MGLSHLISNLQTRQLYEMIIQHKEKQILKRLYPDIFRPHSRNFRTLTSFDGLYALTVLKAQEFRQKIHTLWVFQCYWIAESTQL